MMWDEWQLRHCLSFEKSEIVSWECDNLRRIGLTKASEIGLDSIIKIISRKIERSKCFNNAILLPKVNIS
jgi:hypothetical protein